MLCEFAVKLTLEPGKVDDQDLAPLRQVGFDDDAISIAVQVISYFNYINRVADGLGVDPEESMTINPDEWKKQKRSDY